MSAGPRTSTPGRSLQRVLPEGWQGPSRQARWRRARARRVLAGLLLAVAVCCVVAAVRPADPPTRAVTVAAHDLAAGHRLTAADLRQVRWPAATAVPGALTGATAPGRVLVGPIRTGEAITASRIRHTRSWPAVPAGQVVVSVPADPAGLAAVLQTGDRVDLIDTGRGMSVAESATVLRTSASGGADAGPEKSGNESGAGAGADPAGGATDRAGQVLLAMPTGDARKVAGALAAGSAGLGGGILLALHPTG